MNKPICPGCGTSDMYFNDELMTRAMQGDKSSAVPEQELIFTAKCSECNNELNLTYEFQYIEIS